MICSWCTIAVSAAAAAAAAFLLVVNGCRHSFHEAFPAYFGLCFQWRRRRRRRCREPERDNQRGDVMRGALYRSNENDAVVKTSCLSETESNPSSSTNYLK
jgi:hypothetical protein